ncbi:MAG: hypothetical protein ABI351_02490 [Herbaspirillum sp.]
MGAIDAIIADMLLAHGLNLLRLAADVRIRILTLLTVMSKELTVRLQQEDLTDFGKQRLNTLLRESNVIIDTYYGKAQLELLDNLTGLAKLEADYTAKVLTKAFQAKLSIGLPPTTYLEKLVGDTLIQGSASANWWKKQEMDTQFRFANAVRQGAAQGETTSQIVARVVGKNGIPGVMEVSRKNAYSLVHTSVQAVANAARLETFQKNSDVIAALVWMSTLDSHTCFLCADRDLSEYDLMTMEPLNGALPAEGGPGAIHFSCRCAWTTRSKSFSDLGIDIPEPTGGTRASRDGQVSDKMNFGDWLAGKDAAFRKEYLGAGRAELYESGKITLNDLLDLRGNPLSLAQLQAKYA